MTVSTKDKSLSSTLIRGIQILRCFSSTDERLTNAQIAEKLNINKASISRLCKTLVDQRYLRHDPIRGFRLAPAILALSYPVLSSMKWREEAYTIMADFADFSKGIASLAVFNGAEAIYIQTAGDTTGFPIVPEIGMTMNLTETTTGRALLSLLSQDALRKKYIEIEEYYPGSYEKKSTRIDSGIASCKQNGYCFAFEEWNENLHAFSAPVGCTSDGLYVALSCGIPSYRARREEITNDLAPRLAVVAKELQRMKVFQRSSQH